MFSFELPEVISDTALSNSFLGKAVEFCIVTEDHRRTMAEFCKLGIGPWAVHTFSPETVTEQTYYGEPSEFAIKVCFAQYGGMIWEIMEPLWGNSIFQDFLNHRGSGFHHIAYNCNNLPWEERIKTFHERNFKLVQSGKWMGRNSFAFFDTEDGLGTVLETYHFPEDWKYPEPEAWFPSPPPASLPQE